MILADQRVIAADFRGLSGRHRALEEIKWISHNTFRASELSTPKLTANGLPMVWY